MTDTASGDGFQLPDSLTWLDQMPGGRKWLEDLPLLRTAARNRFGLDLAERPFQGGNVSYVVPATQNGTAVVLKLQFPAREGRFEADALRVWNGNGAVRLLGHAPDLGALLLERLLPGNYLADEPVADRIGVMAGLLKKLLIPASEPFNRLADEAARWRASLENNWQQADRPCEKKLVDAALGALRDLPQDRTDEVLLHQDLHGHNVLSANRSDWLAIDPKPLVGDPAFALSPIVRSFEFGHSKQEALYRLDRLSEELTLDRDRARHWTIAPTMAWAFSSDYSERHFETVRWLMA